MKLANSLRKVPVYFPTADGEGRIEIGQAVVLEDGRIGIRFHQTEAGNHFLEMIQRPEMRGLYISYESAVELTYIKKEEM